MAQLPAAFNPQAAGQEGVGDFSAIDPGDYTAQIVDSQMKMTKNQSGQYLELVWNIISGECAGRRLWSRLNLVNPSVQAVEIAQKHLKSICDALGVPGPISDSQVLHGKPCIISVAKTPATAQYPEGNEVKNYKPVGAGMPVGAAMPTTAFPTTPSAQPVAPAPTTGDAPATLTQPAESKPPWLR